MVNEIANAMAHALDMNATLVPLVDHWHYIDAHFCAARTLDCYFLRQTVCTAFPRAGVYGIPWECEDGACVGTALIYANGTAVYATTNFHWCDTPTDRRRRRQIARTVPYGPTGFVLAHGCRCAVILLGLGRASRRCRCPAPSAAHSRAAPSTSRQTVPRLSACTASPIRRTSGIPCATESRRHACVCLCASPWLPQNLPRCSARPRCARPPPCTRALHRRGHRCSFRGDTRK